MDPWQGFKPGQWMHEIDVRDFIQKNYRPYLGDASFLSPPPTAPGVCGINAGPCWQKSANARGFMLLIPTHP